MTLTQPRPIGDIDRFEIPQRGSRLCYFFCSEAGEGTEHETAHGYQAAGPSVFAQDDGRRTEPATTELRRMVSRVGARPGAA